MKASRAVPYALLTANPEDGGSGDPDITEYDVDMPVLLALYQFYRKDPHISKARQRKLHEVFRSPMSVGHWDAQQQQELGRVALLNNERYQRLLREFLSEAHDHLLLFGFVGYYCVKDIRAWALALSDDASTAMDDQRSGDTLPFGVVRLGPSDLDQCGTFKLQMRRGEMRQRLVFQCDDEDLDSNYDFFVFENGAAFEPLESYTTARPTMLVVTPFLELWTRRKELDETRINALDADFQGTHPESFVIVKPPPEMSVEKVSESIRYTQDTLAQAAFKNNARRIELNHALVNEQLDALQSRQSRTAASTNTLRGSGIDPRGPQSLYTARKRMFSRPDVKETLEVLPESMELNRGPAPAILLSVEAAVYQYETEVCSAMCFPIEFLGTKRQTGSGQGAGTRHNEADLVFSQRQLDEEVTATHTLFHNLFTEVYTRTLGQLEQFVEDVKRRRGHIRLHFEHQASKTDDAVLKLAPLVAAGILGEDEVRAAVLKNYNMKDEESQADRALRKKRLAHALTPPQQQSSNNNNTKKKKKTKKPEKKEKKAAKSTAKTSVSASSASSVSSQSSGDESEGGGGGSSSTTKKKKKKKRSSSSASASESTETAKKKQKHNK